MDAPTQTPARAPTLGRGPLAAARAVSLALMLALWAALVPAQGPPAAPPAVDAAVSRDVRMSTLLGQGAIDPQGRELGRIADGVVDLNNDRLTALVVEDGPRRELPLEALVPRDRGLEAVARSGAAKRDPAPPQPVSARSFTGTAVKDADGADLGVVEDLVVSLDDLSVRYAVVQVAASPGEGRLVPLPLRAFSRTASGDLRASVRRGQLDAAPAFMRSAWPRLSDPAYQARLRAWFATVPVRDATSVKSNQG